jgi:hypothetical protein
MAVGVYATLVAPRWIAGRQLDALLMSPDTSAAHLSHSPENSADQVVADDVTNAVGSTSPSSYAITQGIRASRWSLRQLARLPRSPWRNTCLYQSVAECVFLRMLGVSATLVLGVRAETTTAAIEAHAWVAATGHQDTGYVPLTPARVRAQ